MKSVRIIILLFVLLAGAHPAAAFTSDRSSDTNRDGTSKFSDPDDQLDEMADGDGASHSGLLHFGNGDGVQSYFGAGNYSEGYAYHSTTSAIR